jgi:diguanylate cyclase (GGDEF)-like protein
MRRRKSVPADAVYIELFRITCTGQVPTLLIGVLFSLVAIIVSVETGDSWLRLLAITGILLSLLRLVFMFLYLRPLRVEVENMAQVKCAEAMYVAGSLVFAAILGLLGMRTIQIGPQSLQLLVISLMLGYAAGMVTRGFALFWNCNISLLLAAVPIILAIAWRDDAIYRSLAILLTVFLVGGLESITFIYNTYVERVRLQQKFTLLARNDELTGLFNRLALREGFDVVVRERAAGTLLAVHCLDLDHFKPVNDRFGHPVGDQLLKAVSKRLGHVLRKDDFAARVGGDEFIVVQTGIDHAWQAERLAQRIIEAITAPYIIEKHEIEIGTSIGIALGSAKLDDRDLDLDELISCADVALYDVKRKNRGTYLIGGGVAEEE